MHYGLYGKHRAHNGSRRGNTSAALQEKQIVNGEPVAKVQLCVFDVVAYLFDGGTAVAFLCRKVNKQTFAERSTQRINAVHLSVGILLGKLFANKYARACSAAESGGETDVQNIIACADFRADGFKSSLIVDGRGRCALFSAKLCIQLFFICFGICDGFAALDRDGKRDQAHSVFFCVLRAEIACGVCNNNEFVSHYICLS